LFDVKLRERRLVRFVVESTQLVLVDGLTQAGFRVHLAKRRFRSAGGSAIAIAVLPVA
jgi:hypothetical protein